QAYNLHINKDDISTTCDYFKGLKRRRLESDYETNQTTADELKQYLILLCNENALAKAFNMPPILSTLINILYRIQHYYVPSY
ncbi:37762_t:CDS:2, partial [Gigaspora margarita]